MLALGAAADYYLELGPEWVKSRTEILGAQLRELLAARIPGLTIGDLGDPRQPETRCGIVTFHIAGCDAARMKRKLAGVYLLSAVQCAFTLHSVCHFLLT